MSLLLDAVTKGVPRSQPKGNASINWDHPLSKNMTFDMTASVGPVNNVTGAFATSKTGASTIPSSKGLGYGVSQSSGNCILFSTQVILNTYPFSILLIADTVAEANRKFVFQFGQDTGSSAARVWVLFNGTATGGSSSDSSGKLYLYTIDTSLNQNSPAAGGFAGGIIDGVHSYGITRDASTVSYYRDGKLLGTESPTNSNNVWTSLGITSVNGVSPNLANTRTYDKSLVLTRFWNRRLLSEQDFLSLYQNPWQIYSPRTRDKWITPTISGGATYTLTASTGTFTLTGNSTALTAQRKIVSSVGTFTLTGNATGLSAGRKLTASVGTFTLTGNSATLTYTPSGGYTYTLSAATRSFSLTGNATLFKVSRKLPLSVGTFTLSGISTGLTAGRKITASVGSFTLTGISNALKAQRVIGMDTGSFVLTGRNISFLYTPIGGITGPLSPTIKITRNIGMNVSIVLNR